jgi:hypothetical protein
MRTQSWGHADAAVEGHHHGILAAAGSVVSRGVAVQLIAWLIAAGTTSLVCSAGVAEGRPWILTSIGLVDSSAAEG